ncbi:hypothetical protein [Arthrobacter sp. AZCC_0090]|nr:hypothetical protein [Arthrobacter sp. AZCC_0090]MBB6404223.1 hypothetical protein [Arthrobacter sp. AZCC_0090]
MLEAVCAVRLAESGEDFAYGIRTAGISLRGLANVCVTGGSGRSRGLRL